MCEYVCLYLLTYLLTQIVSRYVISLSLCYLLLVMITSLTAHCVLFTLTLVCDDVQI